MQTYCVETTVSNDRTLTIRELPFQSGDKVEIIIHGYKQKPANYPLRGKTTHYIDPFGSVAENEWDVLK
ncbi:hypothetical protein KKE26_03505 [bacterium]|nr:hypothetical protein [bacterium]MBU1754433.1 hypothetical protein [bacterium]